MVVYNENEPFAADWLVSLADAGHIAHGDIDRRSISDLRPDDVAHATQFHAFAGIGGWSHALRLAGWPDDAPVWTGSCPCQPFSAAGKRAGADDARHLWPEWFRLIRECRPAIVFGEQVASANGRLWLDAVSADLEGVGYAVGAADLCAAGVGAPHIRQRLYWVAYANDARQQGRRIGGDRSGERVAGSRGVAGATHGFWADAEWLQCIDGKERATEPGTFPLAHGIPGRVGRLRGYGNAIVPPLAAKFIRAVMAT